MNCNLSNTMYTIYKQKKENEEFCRRFQIHYETVRHPLVTEYMKDSLNQPLFLQNFFLDIATESVFDYPNPYITEKIIRPMATKRMFIYVGPCYSLKFLKELGFQTFSDFINEDYDNQKDPVKRMMLIEREIERFVNKPFEELKKIITESTPILEHNFDMLKGTYDSELKSIIDQLKAQDV